MCLPIVLLPHTLPIPEFVCSLSQVSSGLVSLPGHRGHQPPGALSEWQVPVPSLSAGFGHVERLGSLLEDCLLLCLREGSCLLGPEDEDSRLF